MMHVCKLCGYSTPYKSCIISHLKRKTLCTQEPPSNVTESREELIKEFEKKYNDITYDCSWCGKKFNHRQNMNYHKKVCKSKPVSSDVPTKEQYDNLLNEIQKLKEETTNRRVQQQNNNCTINNIQQNNNVTINLKSFGFENIAHLEKDIKYMTQCFLNKDVMGLIENIHCDVDHPENHNVRIKSTKKELMEKYVDGRWIISDQEETLDELLNKGYRILNFFSYRNKDHIVNECDDGVDEYHEMRDWLEELYSNTKVRKPLKRKLLILFMNNKTLFLEKKTDDIDDLSNQITDSNQYDDHKDDASDTESNVSASELPPEEAKKYTMYSYNPKPKDVRV
jgi:hypothetical protein